jgi:uncharacterized spore protein YtfJ
MPNVDEILGGAREAITVRRVFGDAYEHEGVTVIPVALVRGGGGGGGDNENNGGAGFGVNARPVGVYVIAGGDVSWRPARDTGRIERGWQIVAALWALAAWSLARSLRGW